MGVNFHSKAHHQLSPQNQALPDLDAFEIIGKTIQVRPHAFTNRNTFALSDDVQKVRINR
jgi:hypothetical protein